ncbi:MAG: SDR family oxidoreductase [Pseudomonadota bacterium]|nr:SDR family oxidoreductase [Pseudomonadota bacterium]
MTASPATRAALVTGAGLRLGRAMALALAGNGFAVAVHYNRSEGPAREVVNEIATKGGAAVAVGADLSREEETASLIARCNAALGPLSLLVNSASVFEADDIGSMSRQSWDRHLETNLRAPAKLAQDFAAQATGGGDKLIVNIIDQRVLKPTPQFLSYTVSKAALRALTTTLAQALGPRGVRVNAIGPGPTIRNTRQSEEDFRRQNEATILRRGAKPEDIVGALLYLIDAEAVTGQMIAVDGGQHLTWKTADVLVSE